MTQYARPDGFTPDIESNWEGDHTDVDNTDDPTGTGADSDYIESAATDCSMTLTLGDTITDPETGADHKLYFRFKRDDGGGSASSSDVTLTVSLKEGGSTRATRVITGDTTPAIGSSFTYNSAASGATGFNLTTGEANSISNYNNLTVDIVYLDNEDSDYLFISQVVLECPDAGGGSTAVPVALNTYRQMREN